MRGLLVLLGLLWLCGLCAAAEGPAPLVLSDAQSTFSLEGHLAAFHDVGGEMDLAAVEAAATAGAFEPVAGAFNPGVDNAGAWWLRFELRATGQGGGQRGGAWWLAVDAHPLTGEVDALVPVAGADGRTAHAWRMSGTDRPVAARDLPVSLFVFRMDLPTDEGQVVYVRLAGSRTIRAQVQVSRLPELVGGIVSVTTVLSALLGAAALLAVAAAVVGAWLRERTLVLLGVSTGLMTGLQVVINGLALQLLSGFSPTVVYTLHGALLYLTACSMIVTIMAIFRGFRQMPWTRRFMQGFLAFCLVGLVLAPFGQHAQLLPVLLVLSLVFCALTILASYRRMRAGETAGLWYFIGFSVYNVGLMAYAGRVLGLLPLTALSAWVFPALVLGQILAIFIGIAVAMQGSQKTRRELEHRLLVTSQQNEKVLEAAVDARTLALREENAARKEAERALRQALREQRNLVSMVSHEFRTPLATIGAAVHVIREGESPLGGMQARELGKIGRAATRLGGLIDTFLAEEWFDRAALQLNVRRVDLRALLAEVAADARTEDERTIAVSGPRDLPALVDPLLLRLAVGNLVSNALKYSSGRVEIGYRAGGGAIEIRVADEGQGVDPAEREAIFERYYRSASHAALPGAGLGLFIVRQVATLHGGSARVEDGAPGSAFVITLPERPDAPSPG
ncbi:MULTISPECIES: sensor histidine kinase [unclassified Xanthobacter]|uniref:sensor histidine kinase n=1 Tax=unclassified Xanthobacter TaxID=2623496 RepID=UPI001F2A0BA9